MLEEGMWSLDYFTVSRFDRLLAEPLLIIVQNAPYTGWSSAYGVSAILRQLQVFLLDRNGYGKSTHEVSTAHNYQCPGCQHRGNLPWPPMKDSDKIIETRLLKAPKMATTTKAMQRLFNSLQGQYYEEEEDPEPTSHDQTPTKENVQPNIQPQTSKVKVEKVDTSTMSEQVKTEAPVTPAKTNSQQKKKQAQPTPKQNNNRRNPKVSAAGFIIEEVCAPPVPPKTPKSKKGKRKSPPSYVDQLIKESIEAEKERLARAQERKAKKAQKTQSKPVDDASVTPVKNDTSAVKNDTTSDVITTPPQTPSPTQEPNVINKQQADVVSVTPVAAVVQPQVGNAAASVPASKLKDPKQKKQTKPKKQKQNNNTTQKKPVQVPTSGFIIEEDCATPQNGEQKSSPSYVDALIKETIAKEKEKQLKTQQKKVKKAQKKPEPKPVKDAAPVTTPVESDTSSGTLTPVNTAAPAPWIQKPEIIEEPEDVNRVTLSDMPYDVLLNIIQYFMWTDLTSMACVNKQLSTITQESHVWKTLCMNYLPGAPIIVKTMSEKMKRKRAAADETCWREMFLKGRDFVKNELRCFHSKLSFEDDVMVSFASDFEKFRVLIFPF